MRLKAVNLEPLFFSEVAKKQLQARFDYSEEHWDQVEKEDFKSNAEVMIARFKKKLSTSVLDKFPSLKIIFTATTGTDHIDTDYCSKKNILIWSLRPHKVFLRTIPSTAEHAFALILSLLRNIPKAHTAVTNGTWNRDLFFGRQLKNKTLGIIGLGRTGSLLAGFAKAFNMNVVYYDPYVLNESFIKQQFLKDLLRVSDIVSLHVHLDETTTYLINEETGKYFKKGAYMVNTSRGKIVDEEVVCNLLESGILQGVATDVLDEEHNNLEENLLFRAMTKGENVIITPHIAGATIDALNDCEEFLANELVVYLENQG